MTTTSIPLNKLATWDGNVRKTAGADTALAELAASIQSIGLLQPLGVREGKKGKFAVVFGGRRFSALTLLAADEKIEADHAVPCSILSEEIDATEASLAENAMRENMHPADEFEAFRALADKGIPPADIGAKFGVTETVVLRRLKLARVSPVIIEAYRNEETTLECVMAFAVTDDRCAQEKVWKALPKHSRDSDWHIRRALTEKEIDASDKRVQFVTLKAYEKAGGKTSLDLFTEGDDGVFILDTDLLNDLVEKKLEKAAAAARAEGWKWVEVREEFGYGEKAKFRELDEEYATLPVKQQAKLAALEKQRAELEDQDAEWDVLGEIDEKIDAINEAREIVWSSETLAIAGAVVSIGYNNKAVITRGLVRSEDVKKLKAQSPGEEVSAINTQDEKATGLPAKLVEQLTRHRTAALAAELIERPDLALVGVVYNLAADLFAGTSRKSCLRISINDMSHDAVEGSSAHAAIDKHRADWEKTLPDTAAKLWAWCLAQEQSTLLNLLAFCTAMSIDAVVKKRGSMDFGTDVSHSDDLAKELNLDMTKWFKPTAENYFNHVTKAKIIEAMKEIGKGGLLDNAKTKKADAASVAEHKAKESDWLPELLRGPVYGTALKDAA